MDNSNERPRNRGKGGRPPKTDQAAHRLTVNLTDEQYARFLTLFEQSGVVSLSAFIAARIFGEEFRVVKTDAATVGFTAKLTELNSQIRHIGVNYNQCVKELHVKFGEQKALSLLYKLEKATIELARIGREVLQLCSEFKTKILGNNGG
ncbi:MAG: MobA protein [Prevotella sp.]|jgi:hypothetical protein|nr:MobA protein [Prevotella sp.]